jgi:hypothetical protein
MPRHPRRRRYTGGKKGGVDAYLAPELARCPGDCVAYTPAGEPNGAPNSLPFAPACPLCAPPAPCLPAAVVCALRHESLSPLSLRTPTYSSHP